MPHQCVRCGSMHEDGAAEILEGCSCGSKMFFFVKKGAKTPPDVKKLSKKDKKQMEMDVYDLIGKDPSDEHPVILDVETIKILKPGKYELDLVQLFNDKNPLIYRLQEGKYMIDIAESFRKVAKPDEK